MKTIKQWLEELPEPYCSQALANFEDGFAWDCPVESMQDAIGFGFTWQHTPQGGDYWASAYDRFSTLASSDTPPPADE